MPIVPEASARPTILPRRYKPSEPLPKNPAPRNSGQRKQSRPTARLRLHPAPSLLSPERPPIQIKKRSILRKRRRSEIEKTILRQLGIMPTLLRLARRRNGTTEAMGGIIIARKRAIFWGTARNFQKTSVGLGNLRAGDWWWWRGYAWKGTLYLLPGLISGRPKTRKSEAGKGFAW